MGYWQLGQQWNCVSERLLFQQSAADCSALSRMAGGQFGQQGTQVDVHLLQAADVAASSRMAGGLWVSWAAGC